MQTLIASMMLSVLFLSAGALAGASRGMPENRAARPQAEATDSGPRRNVTVVIKNRAWPPAAQITVEPCNIRRCLGA